MTIKSRPEQSFQIALVQWLAVVLPADAVCFAIPNSAKRGVVEGNMMKRMGTLAGVPDIEIVHKAAPCFWSARPPRGPYRTHRRPYSHG